MKKPEKSQSIMEQFKSGTLTDKDGKPVRSAKVAVQMAQEETRKKKAR